MSRAHSPILLFDLGGVLIDNITFEELPKLLPAPLEGASLPERWLQSDAVRRYERGEMASAAFGRAFVREWGLVITPEDFLARFAEWPTGPFPGVMDRLADLSRRYTLGLLSNCNPIHWERVTKLRASVDYAFSSHEFGLVKPDPTAFHYVLRQMDRSADQVIFFDDSATNVEAARRCGLVARQTIGFAAVERALDDLGLLTPH